MKGKNERIFDTMGQSSKVHTSQEMLDELKKYPRDSIIDLHGHDHVGGWSVDDIEQILGDDFTRYTVLVDVSGSVYHLANPTHRTKKEWVKKKKNTSDDLTIARYAAYRNKGSASKIYPAGES